MIQSIILPIYVAHHLNKGIRLQGTGCLYAFISPKIHAHLTFVDYSIKFVIWKHGIFLLYNEFTKRKLQ
ncbi:hypothetical protein CJP46_07135 [Paenibacillus sp. XY044]|nr:hypothetical protein CJP46_07135 [Paenibacillus sp. XY044]